MRRWIVFAALVCCSFGRVPAQGLIPGNGKFQVDLDFARFYGDSAQVYVEVYYDIHENNLTYKPDSGQYVGAANMKLVVRKDSAVVVNKEWTVPHVVEDTGKLGAGQKMVGIESFGVTPGNYRMILTAYDVYDPSRRDSAQFALPVEAYPPSKEALSDIELSTSIQSSTNKQSLFYKNTLEVIPNAGRLYGSGLPVVYYYVEAYNLLSPGTQGDLTVHTSVTDVSGKEVLSRDKQKPRAHNSSVEVGTMNISTLRTGTYLFRVSLLDSMKTALATTAKKVFIYKPGSVALDTTAAFGTGGVSASEYAGMTDSMLDLEFAQSKYIASEAEIVQYARLSDLKGKQQFLYEFWRRRNPDPTVSGNDFKQDYFRRVEFATQNLGHGFREGWKTDRGRVYIVYGAYDEVERFPSSSESLPYEIWHYNNLQGGVIFVFVDRTGLGDYQLVHSTHRSEFHDEQWYEEFAQKVR